MRRLGFHVVDETLDAAAPGAQAVGPAANVVNVVVECPRPAATVEDALARNVAGPLQIARTQPLQGPDAAFVLVGLAEAASSPAPVTLAAPARARLLRFLVDELAPSGVHVVFVEPGAAGVATVAAVVAWLFDPADSADGPPIRMLDGHMIDVEAVAAEYGLGGGGSG